MKTKIPLVGMMDDECALRALIYLHTRKSFEQAHAEFLSGISKQILTKKAVTRTQLDAVKRTLVKYNSKLNGAKLKPVKVKIIGTLLDAKGKGTKTVKLEDGKFIVKFGYSRELVGQIKKLPVCDRAWNPKDKHWILSADIVTAKYLSKLGFRFYKKAKAILDGCASRPDGKKRKVDLSRIKHLPLYKFQFKGVEFIEHNNGRALLADEMGLGKSCQALSWLKIRPELRPALIVSPASLKLNWGREGQKWETSNDITVLNGMKPDANDMGDLSIINYDILSAWLPLLMKLRLKALILDESHYLANMDTLRTKAARKLAKDIEHIVALSGTPIINAPIEFFPVLNMIDPLTFPNRWKFAQRFCNVRHNGFGWDFTGSSNSKELHRLLTTTVMLRRKKCDVLTELPAKTRVIVPLQIDQKKYREEIASLKQRLEVLIKKEQTKISNKIISIENKLKKGTINDSIGRGIINELHKDMKYAGSANAMIEIEKTKQIIVELKMGAACEWIQDFIAQDEKLVVFTTHTKPIDDIKNRFKNISVTVDGRVSSKIRKDGTSDRQNAVDLFQADPNVKLFIGQISAAGVGLTLTASSSTAFIELDPRPGIHEQAEDRVHRIGQEADAVWAYYLVAENTIEEKLAKILDDKAKILSKVLDGEEVDEKELLTELIKQIRKEI